MVHKNVCNPDIIYFVDVFEFRFQAPVRDEESESQRKARSRLMRQSRRSTQVLFTREGYCQDFINSFLSFYSTTRTRNHFVTF